MTEFYSYITKDNDRYKYVDYPVNEAIPNIIRETTDAINLWETRIKVNSVSAVIDSTNITIKVEWTLKDSNVSATAEVTL